MCQTSPDGINYPGPGVTMNGWLMKTDLLGNLQWSNITPSLGGNRFTGVTAAPDGTLFTCGSLGTVSDAYGSAQLTKHSPTGSLIWERQRPRWLWERWRPRRRENGVPME